MPVLMLAVSALAMLHSTQGAQRPPVCLQTLLLPVSARRSPIHGAGATDFAPAPAPAPSASSNADTAFLYIIQAANATLSIPNARTPNRGNLRMTGLDSTSVWFSNKPVRRAGRVMTEALAGSDYYRINGALAHSHLHLPLPAHPGSAQALSRLGAVRRRREHLAGQSQRRAVLWRCRR